MKTITDATAQFMLAEGNVRTPRINTALHFCSASESQQMECFIYADEQLFQISLEQLIPSPCITAVTLCLLSNQILKSFEMQSSCDVNHLTFTNIISILLLII